jgi:hypothetical protein
LICRQALAMENSRASFWEITSKRSSYVATCLRVCDSSDCSTNKRSATNYTFCHSEKPPGTHLSMRTSFGPIQTIVPAAVRNI